MTATTRKKIHQGLDNVGFIGGTENIIGISRNWWWKVLSANE